MNSFERSVLSMSDSDLREAVTVGIRTWRQRTADRLGIPYIDALTSAALKRGLTPEALGSSVEEVRRLQRDALVVSVRLAIRSLERSDEPNLENCRAAIAAATAEGIDLNRTPDELAALFAKAEAHSRNA